MAFHYYEVSVRSGLKDRRKLSVFLAQVLNEHLELETIDVTYVFCDDAYLLEKNLQFLKHDTYTDIITFDLSEDSRHLVSEIYISTPRIKENADKFGVSYQNELHRVIFHGVLHLCGFLDHSPEDDKLMRKMENECLERFALMKNKKK